MRSLALGSLLLRSLRETIGRVNLRFDGEGERLDGEERLDAMLGKYPIGAGV